jgi:hypothetical protein
LRFLKQTNKPAEAPIIVSSNGIVHGGNSGTVGVGVEIGDRVGVGVGEEVGLGNV